ncbi:MAG: DUF2271 domain-containing protein [Dysgonamonadaceae bacterium]|jgi:hypothetical protein|nr:DUF2271 domain-containing protein [Dysgonamonadaceae bacterium]
MNIRFLSFLLLFPLLMGGCKKSAAPSTASGAVLNILVDYEKQPGPGGNQWAVWVEDSAERIVKTLYVTRFTADGGYVPRPACTPLWVKKALPGDLSQEAIDAFSGATPSSGLQTYEWNITDDGNRPLENGAYTLMVEATLYGESEVIYKTPVTVGNQEWTIDLEPFYTSADTINKNMIRSVRAEYRLGSH